MLDPAVLGALLTVGAIAIAGALGYLARGQRNLEGDVDDNESRIDRNEQALYGHPEADGPAGLEGEHDSLAQQLDDLRTTIDQEAAERERDHRAVERELHKIEHAVDQGFRNLAAELDADVDEEDLVPDPIDDRDERWRSDTD